MTRGKLSPESIWTEMMSGLGQIAWALLLLLPAGILDTNPSFQGLKSLLHGFPWALGLIGWTVGGIQIFGVIHGRPWMRLLGCLSVIFLWGFIATGLGISAPRWHFFVLSTGFPIYSLFVLFNIGAAWNLGAASVLDHKVRKALKDEEIIWNSHAARPKN